MKKLLLTSLSTLSALLVYSWLFTLRAHAVCPVCTIAVGAGLVTAEKYGIDDTITGLWIGGLTVSMIMWTVNWLNKRNIRFKGRKILIALGYYALIVIPLYAKAFIGHPLHKLWGIDKLLLSITLGSIAFFVMAMLYEYLKKRNDGHAYFPFQRVVMPVGILIILSAIFYYVTKG